MTTQDSIPVGLDLTCGCCGSGFLVWPEYQNQDQNAGFGICKRCQDWISEKNEHEWDKAIKTLRDALNDKNRAKFDTMHRETQKFLVQKAMDDGIMKWTIGGR